MSNAMNESPSSDESDSQRLPELDELDPRDLVLDDDDERSVPPPPPEAARSTLRSASARAGRAGRSQKIAATHSKVSWKDARTRLARARDVPAAARPSPRKSRRF
jgi:hypothetical protein